MLDTSLHNKFCILRKKAIAMQFNRLNAEQQQGILSTEGPLLLLAGAGSGKTTVLINRIVNLLRFGGGSDRDEVPSYIKEEDLAYLEAYIGQETHSEEDNFKMQRICALEPAKPWQILAITFTNKAAGELKERLEQSIGGMGQDVWAATFHSACVRILRREIEVLGFPSSFTIYDSDDSLRVIKASMKELNIDEKMLPPRTIMNYISKAKDECMLAEEYLEESRNNNDYRREMIAKVYQSYQNKLWSAGALDFDDIILHTVRILQQHKDVRAYYQQKFRYILVDEYQDTNHLQYLLTTLLADGHKNLCVVGDDDQSIYRFRGATIRNILSFEQDYPNARVIRLEQNYRSTGHILESANAVIGNNQGRKGKKLWTDQGNGEKIQVYEAFNEQDEANHVANQILEAYREGTPFRDNAVLYRMNALSNQMEIAFKRNSISYKIVGGVRYFERAEVKDMLSYLCVIHNPRDDLRLLRIINVPARGIGKKALDTLKEVAEGMSLPLWSVLERVEQYPSLAKSAPKFRAFYSMMEELQQAAQFLSLPEFYEQVMEKTGYMAMLNEKPKENMSRIENVKELRSSIAGYLENTEEGSLSGFLDEVALYTDLDSHDETNNSVTLMTMHAAKGLEFPHVFVVGMEEGVFPGFRSIGETEELEEERRLCYVAMTRAKKVLHLSSAGQRMLFGKTTANLPSRFSREIPEEYLNVRSRKQNAQTERPVARETIAPPSNYHAVPKNKVAYRKPPIKSAPLPSYTKGDMVEHKAFGKGMILSIQAMGGDALIEIAFDTVGTKRMMLKTAAQHMTK